MSFEVEEDLMEVDVKMYCEDVDLIPKYETEHAAGFDLKANIPAGETWVIPPGITNAEFKSKKQNWIKRLFKSGPEITDVIITRLPNWKLIPTGVRTEIPIGYEIQIRPRSGLALKNGISLMNCTGTVDCDYRNDIGVILVNHGVEPFEVTRGMRIAQGILAKVERMNRIAVRTTEELSSTQRGEGGFGSSGIK